MSVAAPAIGVFFQPLWFRRSSELARCGSIRPESLERPLNIRAHDIVELDEECVRSAKAVQRASEQKCSLRTDDKSVVQAGYRANRNIVIVSPSEYRGCVLGSGDYAPPPEHVAQRHQILWFGVWITQRRRATGPPKRRDGRRERIRTGRNVFYASRCAET